MVHYITRKNKNKNQNGKKRKVGSTINGNNGSWTNSDDVKLAETHKEVQKQNRRKYKLEHGRKWYQENKERAREIRRKSYRKKTMSSERFEMYERSLERSKQFNERLNEIRVSKILLDFKNLHKTESQLNGNNGEVTNADDLGFCSTLIILTLILITTLITTIMWPIITLIFSINISLVMIVYEYVCIIPHLIRITFMSFLILNFPRNRYLRIFIGLAILIIGNHEIKSSLNGNNGSYSNTDDVKTTFGRIRGKQDSRVETQTFSESAPGKENKICRSFSKNGKCNYKDCKYIHIQKEEEIKICPYFQIGKCTSKNCKMKHEKIEIVKEKEKIIVEIPAFRYGNEIYEKVTGELNFDIIGKLRKQMPIINSQRRNQAGIAGFLRSNYPNMSNSEIILYRNYHLHDMFQLGHEESHDPNIVPVLHRSNVNSVILDPEIEIEAVKPTKIPDWRYNSRWIMKKYRGFTFETLVDNEELNTKKVITYPKYETHKIESKKKYFMLCGFQGYANFLWYDVCAESAESALARYLSARPDEDILVENQMELCGGIKDDIIKEMCDMCGAEFIEYPDTHYNSVKFKSGREEFYDKNNEWSKLHEYYQSQVNDKWFIYSLYLYLAYLFISTIFNELARYIYVNTYNCYDRMSVLAILVSLPSPKRILYTKWFEDETVYNMILNNNIRWTSKVKWEIAKVNSYPRLYASAEHACLVDKIAPEISKFIDKEPLKFHEINPNEFGVEFTTVFVDCQEPIASDNMFNTYKNNPGYNFIFYSDDGFLHVNLPNGQQLTYETDISKCDLSNGFSIFCQVYQRLKYLVGEKLAGQLLKQSTLPTTLYNPNDGSEYVCLEPESFFEYSGCNLTTLLNNFASKAIAYAIYLQLVQAEGVWGGAQMIIEGAKSAGFVLTVKECQSLACATYLKRAFDGEKSFLCLGTLLRSFGVVESYSPEVFGISREEFDKKTRKELFEIYGYNRIQSLINEPDNIILMAMRKRFKIVTNRYGLPNYFTRTESICERYDLQIWELEILAEQIVNLQYGDRIHCSALDKIFKVDYGVEKHEDFTLLPDEQIKEE